MHNSLLLIKSEKFAVEVSTSCWDGVTKRNYRGKFKYNGIFYNLRTTDPAVWPAYRAKEEGEYPLGNVFLCVSLTQPYDDGDGRCHKLVAAILTERLLR